MNMTEFINQIKNHAVYRDEKRVITGKTEMKSATKLVLEEESCKMQIEKNMHIKCGVKN